MFDVPGWIEWVAFGCSMFGAACIFALSMVSLVCPAFQFFPPPDKRSWQYGTFRLLFRLFLYPLVVLSILTFELSDGSSAIVRYVIGGALAAAGIGVAFWISIRMGWRNAFGEERGLQTTGWFRLSRNPVYVATWVGLLGWGIVVPELLVIILLMLWGILYMVAPFLEEPWLEARYGDNYRKYRRSTPRFF